MCKRIFKFDLQSSSYWQNIKFSHYCPKFYIFTKIVIFWSIFAAFKTCCFLAINLMAGTCQEYSFSFLPVVSRLDHFLAYIATLTTTPKNKASLPFVQKLVSVVQYTSSHHIKVWWVFWKCHPLLLIGNSYKKK